MVTLRKELKQRGLSTYVLFSFCLSQSPIHLSSINRKGNKADLVNRIQSYDERATLEAISDPSTSRKASLSAEPTPETGVAPGIPADQQPNEIPPIDFLNIKIPDIQKPDPDAEALIVR